MTMLDHDAVDEIGDSEDENDGDDVNDFHYGKHKTENNSKNKKLQRSTKNELKRSYSASTLREPKTYIG